jgi:transposase
MMAGEFWLSEAQWGAIGPLLPKNQPGARRTDDRRVISGVVHVLKTGCRWQDCPAVYGPSTTVYNRFRRWTMRGIWRRLFDALVRADPGDGQAIDSTTAKAHRSAAGGKGGRRRRRLAVRAGGRATKIHAIVDAHGRPIAIEVTPGHLGDVRVATALITGVPAGGCLAADAAYDSDGLRRFLLQRGTVPVIPNNPTRKRHHPFDETAYRQRNLIERMFCRLKDWRPIATRYDKLAATFAAAVMIAAVITWWT